MAIAFRGLYLTIFGTNGLLRISDLNTKSPVACPRSTPRVIKDEHSWESISTRPAPPFSTLRTASPAGKGMATSYVGQVSVHSKHYEPSRTPQRDMSNFKLDLRFEQTYLKSIAPHVRLTTPVSDENEKREDLVYPQDQQLDIRWGKVIWITTRDQVLLPMFQGMIWGTMSPWVQYFRGDSASPSKSERPSKTGAAIAKLRSWLSFVIPPTPTPFFRAK